MDLAKDQPPTSRLRYPLRSAGKSRDTKLPEVTPRCSSSRKGTTARVSASIGAIKLSKESETPKSLRRLSVPSTIGSATPISNTRVKRRDPSANNGSPISDGSKSARNLNQLSSVSYWLSQIKLSESVSKHNVSLGFFKLALESECVPLEKVREELKSYANRHKLLELGEPAREVLNSYNILEEVQASSPITGDNPQITDSTEPLEKPLKVADAKVRIPSAEKNLGNAPKSLTPRTSSDSKKMKPKTTPTSSKKKNPSPGIAIRAPVSVEDKENLHDEHVEKPKSGPEVETV
ncbi:uncharacterized protein LOC144709379 [Wolffia australiana]